MAAVECIPSNDNNMTPRTVPARRKSSLDFLKKAATSGSTRIRSISNASSIRSLFASDSSISNNDDDDDKEVPDEITIGGTSTCSSAALGVEKPTATRNPPNSRLTLRSRRRSSSINSDKTRDSFEIMIRNAGGSDDVRRGSLYRPRSSSLEELAMMSASAIGADDNIDEDNKSDEAHIHRLVACLDMTSAEQQERLPTKSILRSSSQPNLNEPNVDGTNSSNSTTTLAAKK